MFLAARAHGLPRPVMADSEPRLTTPGDDLSPAQGHWHLEWGDDVIVVLETEAPGEDTGGAEAGDPGELFAWERARAGRTVRLPGWVPIRGRLEAWATRIRAILEDCSILPSP